jgi:hypothetical protein
VFRSLLDNAYENEAKCKSEAEQARRELMRVQEINQIPSNLKNVHKILICARVLSLECTKYC